jgi:hypothetical protein
MFSELIMPQLRYGACVMDDPIGNRSHSRTKLHGITVGIFSGFQIMQFFFGKCERFKDLILRCLGSEAIVTTAEALPGTVQSVDKTGIEVACGAGRLRLLELQLPGARAVTAGEFINAHAMTGVRLGGE